MSDNTLPGWNPFSKATVSDIRRLLKFTLDLAWIFPWKRARPAGLYFFWWDAELVYIGKSENIPKRVKQHLRQGRTKNGEPYNRVTWMAVDADYLTTVESSFINFFLPGPNRHRPNYDEALAESLLRSFKFSPVKGPLTERLRQPDGRKFPPTCAGVKLIWNDLRDEDRELLALLVRRGRTPREELNLGRTQLMRISTNAVSKCRSASPIVCVSKEDGKYYEVPERYHALIRRLAKASGIHL